ncbi:MAG: HD domain-containing protein [Candidatus Aenigmarchaeota archaeon]|nr:HD domain-containing protein [Candidatus Aenigmarchaeota archaeon]
MAIPTKIMRMHTYRGPSDVDITELTELIDTEEFQRLKRVNQVSCIDHIYPDANHKRFSHVLGTGYLAKQSNPVLGLDERDSRLNFAYANTHDIGHGPESHEWEIAIHDITGVDHKQKGIERIRSKNVRKAVEGMGVKIEDLEAMHTRENPLHKVVSSRVGLDKLDYIERDAYFCSKGAKMDIERIVNHMIFDGKNYAIDERARDDVKLFLDAMVSAYHEIYLVKALQIVRTMLSRAICYSIQDKSLDPEKGWDMDDYQLKECLEKSSSEAARGLMRRLGSRDFLKTAGVIKLDGCREYEPIKGKPITVECINRQDKDAFGGKYGKIQNLTRLEERIAKDLGFQKGEVLLSIPPTLEVSNAGSDVLIRRKGSRDDLFDSGLRSIYGVFPGLKEHLLTQTENQYAIRMLVPGESRERVYGILEEKGMKRFLF